MIGIAPTCHVHRRVNRELAQVGPHHLEQELQLVALVGALNDVQT
ncbi:hypothetical protein [Streptomyces sp. fd1-xmd]|nr:hypothetical protein [Streptomyces sp. fd1-xmd]